MCVCMHVRVCVHACVRVCVYVHACVRVCVCFSCAHFTAGVVVMNVEHTVSRHMPRAT